MQLFIGGACAGKRDAVKKRFPHARWWRLAPGQRLHEASHAMRPNTPLVLYGLFDWLTAALSTGVSTEVSADMGSDAWRAQWRADLRRLNRDAAAHNVVLVLIANELGRGLVPMDDDQRRLRDASGWFNQDAAAHAEQVWYVRHGLLQALNGGGSN